MIRVVGSLLDGWSFPSDDVSGKGTPHLARRYQTRLPGEDDDLQATPPGEKTFVIRTPPIAETFQAIQASGVASCSSICLSD